MADPILGYRPPEHFGHTDRDVVIRFRGVNKAFGPKVVYEGLDIDVFEGETLSVIGASGAGKSVMLKLLLRLLEADAGSITAFGEEVTTLSPTSVTALRRRVAMLFQGGALFDSMTVEQNIKYPLREHNWGDEERISARVTQVLDMVGMPGVEKLRPAELSGGMKKRVGLARAIAIQPDIILYDEPTTGLDPINVRRINGLIRDLQSRLGITSIVVTHDMDSAFTVADRFAMIYECRMGFVGSRVETEECGLPWVHDFIMGGRGVLDHD
jgi:phospholipid/cholesterol/gamma-HCH transport system ATP-binding protein